MRYTERPNNTPEQVREYISAAVELVGELELSDELRVPAFNKAVDLFAGKQVTLEMVQPQGFDLSQLRQG